MQTLTTNELHDFSTMLNVQASREEISRWTQDIIEQKDELLSLVKTSNTVADTDFIDRELRKFTLDELKTLLYKDPSMVDKFFINPHTGEEVEFAIPFKSEKKKNEFKRDFLLHIASSNEALDGILQQEKELSEYITEMNRNIRDVTISLSDNILNYIEVLKDRANAVSDERKKSQMIKTIYYIESGFTLNVFRDNLSKYPSVLQRCVDELTDDVVLSRTGKRYLDKLNRYKVPASLIMFISNGEGVISFEEKMLIKDEDYKIPDLFIYSLIRFFSMADWGDNNIRRLHSSVMIMLKRLIRNELSEEVKTMQLGRIVDYIALFTTS